MAETYALVIGAAGIDTKGKPFGPPVPRTSNPGAIRISTGGVARNVAENLARLGQHVILLSAVGDDRSGTRVIDQALEAGIDVEHILVCEGQSTAAYIAINDERGNLAMSVDDMRVLQKITPRFIYDNRRLIRDAEMVFIDANLQPPTIATVLRQASRYGVPVCADPTSVSLAQYIKPHLRELFMVTPNVAEAEALCKYSIGDSSDSAIRAARRLVKMGVSVAIIKLAEMGVCYATNDESGHVPAIKTEIVDGTGAGDALTAGVIFGIVNDFSVDEAVRLAASAAAMTLKCEETVCRTLSLDNLYDQLVI